MAKRFVAIFFIVMAITLFLVVGFAMLLFLAPGFSAFGLRYIAYGTRLYDSGKLIISDEIGSFNGNVILETKEIPVYVCYSQGTEIEVRYFENFSGLTKSKIENPYLDVFKDDAGNAIVKINEYEKFIFQNPNTTKFVKLFIPLQSVCTSGLKAYKTDITLNLNKSNLTFQKDNGGGEELRIPTHRNVTIKTNGKISYETEIRAKKYSYETENSIVIGKDKLDTINADDYTLVSGGRITIERDVTGDIRAKTNNGNLKLIGCKNLYAETGHGHIEPYKSDTPIDVFGIVKIETKTGNVTLGEVNGDGQNVITTGSGNVIIKKIKDGEITTKRGSVKVNSVRDMKITTSMGKVVVEEALANINVYSHRGSVTVGGEGMTVVNPTLESRLGKVSLTSATGNVVLKTAKADIKFVNTNSSNIEIYSGGKTTATGLTGDVKINSEKDADLRFTKITGNTTIKLGDKCANLKLYAVNDNASETRYILSGKNVTMYEDDLNDDVDAYKMDSKSEFTNKLNGQGPLLDVTGKNVVISAYFKIENSVV